MTVSYNDVNVYVEDHYGEKAPIVVLHGWGANVTVMQVIINYLISLGHRVIALDFPGFGKSGLPRIEWGIYEYADCVSYVINRLNVIKPLVIGHSFGGRVAVILASKQLASALILTASAGIKPKLSITKAVKIAMHKLKKRLNLPSNGGSSDYKALTSEMKGVFVKVVNQHLHDEMRRINVPTLLIWGKDDTETPIYMAKKMNKLIVDSGLCIIEDCGHFVFLDNPPVFLRAIKSFIEYFYGGSR